VPAPRSRGHARHPQLGHRYLRPGRAGELPLRRGVARASRRTTHEARCAIREGKVVARAASGRWWRTFCAGWAHKRPTGELGEL
jgi:hypothetical protein